MLMLTLRCVMQICERVMSPEEYAGKKKKLEKKRPELAKASHTIMICMKRQAKPEKLMPEWEELSAVACAVQNIYLMTGPLGLGGGPLHCSSSDFILVS